jgi:TPR repeat protein
MAEIRDDKLFQQPDESHLGECPICCLPLSLDENKFSVYSCCCKRICNGCAYANQKREVEQGLETRCPHCREPLPETEEEAQQNEMKKAKANDPVAMLQRGKKRYREGDFEGAFEYFTKAAALGNADAHHNLSVMYNKGQGVEKDMKKYLHHMDMEEAAIGGHHVARFNLGCYEQRQSNYDRAIKLGDDGTLALEELKLKQGFQMGVVSKEDYEVALRGHQAAVDATKSEQRDAAEKYYYRFR